MRTVCLIILILTAPAVWACSALEADAGWVRRPPPGASSTAGYLTLRNTGERPVKVVAASSEHFATTMIHQTTHKDGRATMRHLSEIEILPGEAFVAEPGGAHLMLMQPTAALKDGARVSIQFHCAQGESLTTTLMVQRYAPTDAP